MKNLKAENKLVVALFVMVLVTFSFAQKDSQRITQMYADMAQKQQQLLTAAQQRPEKVISQVSYFAKISPSR